MHWGIIIHNWGQRYTTGCQGGVKAMEVKDANAS